MLLIKIILDFFCLKILLIGIFLDFFSLFYGNDMKILFNILMLELISIMLEIG